MPQETIDCLDGQVVTSRDAQGHSVRKLCGCTVELSFAATERDDDDRPTDGRYDGVLRCGDESRGLARLAPPEDSPIGSTIPPASARALDWMASFALHRYGAAPGARLDGTNVDLSLAEIDRTPDDQRTHLVHDRPSSLPLVGGIVAAGGAGVLLLGALEAHGSIGLFDGLIWTGLAVLGGAGTAAGIVLTLVGLLSHPAEVDAEDGNVVHIDAAPAPTRPTGASLPTIPVAAAAGRF